MFTDFHDMFPLMVSIGILVTVFCLAVSLHKPSANTIIFISFKQEPILPQHIPTSDWISYQIKRKEAPEEDPDHHLLPVC